MNARSLRRRRQVDELVDRVAIDELIDAQGPLEIAPVAIVIAAYKERDNIAQVIEGMPKEVCGLQASLIVVVDGEDDGTGAVVREAGHYACVAPVNRGQGAALRLGYRIARENGARFIVTSDADGQTDPDDLEVVSNRCCRDGLTSSTGPDASAARTAPTPCATPGSSFSRH